MLAERASIILLDPKAHAALTRKGFTLDILKGQKCLSNNDYIGVYLMKTVVTFSPNYNTVFPSSAINFGLRLAPQAGVHNLKTEFSDQKALN